LTVGHARDVAAAQQPAERAPLAGRLAQGRRVPQRHQPGVAGAQPRLHLAAALPRADGEARPGQERAQAGERAGEQDPEGLGQVGRRLGRVAQLAQHAGDPAEQ
jgi:hypothetical protein